MSDTPDESDLNCDYNYAAYALRVEIEDDRPPLAADEKYWGSHRVLTDGNCGDNCEPLDEIPKEMLDPDPETHRKPLARHYVVATREGEHSYPLQKELANRASEPIMSELAPTQSIASNSIAADMSNRRTVFSHLRLLLNWSLCAFIGGRLRKT